MATIVTEILKNVSFIFALTFVYSLLRPSLLTLPTTSRIVINGILLGLIAIIGISVPIVIKPGIFFDGRGVVIGLAALFGGWHTGLVTALLVIGYRATLGGAGILPTVLTSLLHVLVGAVFHRSLFPSPQAVRGRDLVIVGLGLACNVLIANGLMLPPDTAQSILTTTSLPLLITYPFGMFLTGTLLKFQINQQETANKLRIGNAAIKFGRDGILIGDMKGNLLLANHAAASMLGYEDENGLPAGEPIYGLLAQNDQKRFKTYIGTLLGGQHLSNSSETLEMNFTRHDGSSFLADCAIAPISNGMIGFVMSLRDSSKFKQAEQTAVALALEQQKVQILHGFIGDASHDLKTPLSILGTSAYLMDKNHEKMIEISLNLLKAYADNDTANIHTQLNNLLSFAARAREAGQRLEQTIERLDYLVNDLLSMVQLDQISEIALRPRDLNAMIAPLIASYQALAEDSKQTLIFLPEEQLPPVMLDENNFERILENLVTNAVKYTPEGGTITLRTCRAQDNVVLEVLDSGIGIAPEALPHIFDRFYRVDKSRPSDMGGTGLGLAIVKRLVELHHGTITAESVVNVGSAFRISLPMNSTL